MASTSSKPAAEPVRLSHLHMLDQGCWQGSWQGFYWKQFCRSRACLSSSIHSWVGLLPSSNLFRGACKAYEAMWARHTGLDHRTVSYSVARWSGICSIQELLERSWHAYGHRWISYEVCLCSFHRNQSFSVLGKFESRTGLIETLYLLPELFKDSTFVLVSSRLDCRTLGQQWAFWTQHELRSTYVGFELASTSWLACFCCLAARKKSSFSSW